MGIAKKHGWKGGKKLGGPEFSGYGIGFERVGEKAELGEKVGRDCV